MYSGEEGEVIRYSSVSIILVCPQTFPFEIMKPSWKISQSQAVTVATRIPIACEIFRRRRLYCQSWSIYYMAILG